MEPHTENQDLLVFEENLVRADTGKRFFNYIIDVLSFYAVMFCFGAVMGLINPSVIDSIYGSGSSLDDRIVSIFLYGIYMGIVEGLFKGKSLGKLITKTRAVNYDGSRISWGKALGRGFSRAVPFCVLSALSSPCNPWHDRWTSTMVIDEKHLINTK